MNRQQKRLLEKKRRKSNMGESSEKVSFTSDGTQWTLDKYSKPIDEPQEPQIPGVNVRPIFPEFEKQVNCNRWHDREEFNEVIETIKKLSVEDDYSWSWAKNWDCKYVDIRIDMRDGGFVLTDREGKRINLEQLKWQYKSPKGHE